MIPESPFYFEGKGGLFNFIEERLKENGHLVIVIAEGAGQEYATADLNASADKDASGNQLLLDVGPWLSQKIKVFCIILTCCLCVCCFPLIQMFFIS